MTTTQKPNALKLADRHKYRVRALDSGWNAEWKRSTDEFDLCVKSESELRRQHAEIERLTAAIDTERTARQAAQRQLADLQELQAKSGLAHRKAVQEAVAEAVAAERDRLCAAIKAADDKASDDDYMLDSDDCISVIRGTWGTP